MPSARQSLLAAALLLTLALGTRWLASVRTSRETPPRDVAPGMSTGTAPAAEPRCPAGTLEDGGACVPVQGANL